MDAITKANPDAEVRICRRAVAGKTVLHQGDVYLHAVPKDWPRGEEIGTRQVAVGTTVGSRHVAEGDGVTVCSGKKLPAYMSLPEGARVEDLLGPVVSGSGEPFVLTHPEHAHHQCPTADVDWQVTYQFNPATARRVQD